KIAFDDDDDQTFDLGINKRAIQKEKSSKKEREGEIITIDDSDNTEPKPSPPKKLKTSKEIVIIEDDISTQEITKNTSQETIPSTSSKRLKRKPQQLPATIVISSLESDSATQPMQAPYDPEDEYSEVDLDEGTPELKGNDQFTKPYKYVDQHPVRRREERQALPGRECEHCKKFYDAIDMSAETRNQFVHDCSKHKERFTPPSTPPGFWDVGFPSSEASSTLDL
ncbi:DNA endonuclease RBBP8-like, partial [Planoprotostelium fungivorum]